MPHPTPLSKCIPNCWVILLTWQTDQRHQKHNLLGWQTRRRPLKSFPSQLKTASSDWRFLHVGELFFFQHVSVLNLETKLENSSWDNPLKIDCTDSRGHSGPWWGTGAKPLSENEIHDLKMFWRPLLKFRRGNISLSKKTKQTWFELDNTYSLFFFN